jgi:hypothetical protein
VFYFFFAAKSFSDCMDSKAYEYDSPSHHGGSFKAPADKPRKADAEKGHNAFESREDQSRPPRAKTSKAECNCQGQRVQAQRKYEGGYFQRHLIEGSISSFADFRAWSL